MPTVDDSKWLWIGLGCFSVLALRVVIYQLNQVPAATEVSKSKRKSRPRIIDQETEDALKLDALRTLVDGSNHDIRGVAAKILCQRSASGPTFDLLLEDVASPVPHIRDKGLVALRYLVFSEPGEHINTQALVRAVVIALAHILRDPSRTSSTQRFPPERNAMVILSSCLRFNVPAALKAGIVRQWLAHYPFGANEAEKHASIKNLSNYQADDYLMSEIVCALENFPGGRKEMRQAGLTGSAIDEDSDGDERMVDGEDTAGTVPLAREPPIRRLREESLEEQRLRRRRREAMVLSDGIEPLGRGDIIQRDDGADIREEDIERELGELMDQVRREENERQPSSWRTWLPWRSD